MCFTKNLRKNRKNMAKYKAKGKAKDKAKKVKINIGRNKIYPHIDPEFYINENILCYGCQNEFPLESNKIQIHCAGCHRFFHCKIAGTCYGPNCYTETNRGQKHYLSWCINCVPGIPQNKIVTVGSDKCTCHNCHNCQ